MIAGMKTFIMTVVAIFVFAASVWGQAKDSDKEDAKRRALSQAMGSIGGIMKQTNEASVVGRTRAQPVSTGTYDSSKVYGNKEKVTPSELTDDGRLVMSNDPGIPNDIEAKKEPAQLLLATFPVRSKPTGMEVTSGKFSKGFWLLKKQGDGKFARHLYFSRSDVEKLKQGYSLPTMAIDPGIYAIDPKAKQDGCAIVMYWEDVSGV